MLMPLSIHRQLQSAPSFKSPTGCWVFTLQLLFRPLPIRATGPSLTYLFDMSAYFSVLKAASLFQLPPADTENLFVGGMSLVFTCMKPPVKSAGYSAAGDFTIIMLSIWLLGMISNENARESGSELGTAPPFIHTLLYRCDNPLTITNLSSMRLTPGIRLITSPALLSCVRFISCAETLFTTTWLFLAASVMASSVFFMAIPVITTSPRACWSAPMSMSSVYTPFLSEAVMLAVVVL